MSRKLLFLLAAVLVVEAGVFIFHGHSSFAQMLAVESRRAESAAVFFVESITVNQLHLAYSGLASTPVTFSSAQPKKVRVLIVPGHEPQSGGAAFGSYSERDVVSDIAEDLAATLRANPHYEVIVARSRDAWNPTLSEYFNSNSASIAAFEAGQKALMQQYIAQGRVTKQVVGQEDHHAASDETALRLYGINKWASENNIDITLHLHINDYAGRRWNELGTYAGFSVYVPEHQYSNAAASRAIGDAIAARLNAYHATSTMPAESAGVLEDQELIAIGSNNTADAASVLIEYAYIYERQFADPQVRTVAESEYAYQTYLGLQDFFKDPAVSSFGTNVLPLFWSATPIPKTESAGLYGLQTAMHRAGLYPAPGGDFGNCPLSGYFGSCTTAAVKAIQQKNNIPETGLLDSATLAALRQPLAGAVIFSTPEFH